MVVEGGRGVERQASSVKSSSSILGERVELLNLAPLSRVGWSAFRLFRCILPHPVTLFGYSERSFSRITSDAIFSLRSFSLIDTLRSHKSLSERRSVRSSRVRFGSELTVCHFDKLFSPGCSLHFGCALLALQLRLAIRV